MNYITTSLRELTLKLHVRIHIHCNFIFQEAEEDKGTAESLQTVVAGAKKFRRGGTGPTSKHQGFGSGKRQGMAGVNE